MSERDMRKLMRLIAQRVGLTYADVSSWLAEQNSLEAIEQRILANNYGGAIANVDDAAKRIAAEIQEGYITAGQQAADYLDARVPAKLIRFDTTSPHIVRRAEMNQLELVHGFREERYKIAQQITKRATEEGARLGTNPRRVAQDFRDSISLTPSQADWVGNYRRSLESGDYTKALGYELSDGNADRTIRAVQGRGGRLSPAQVDNMVERYRQNAITHRAEAIARTEGLSNAREGVDDAYRQAIGRGDIEADQLDVEWHSRSAGPRARELHQAMDGKRVPFGEDFVLPDGTRMSGPGDPRGKAKHNVNCGCVTSVAIRAEAAREDAAELRRRARCGLSIVIENPVGSVRRWTDSDGTSGKTTMRYAYGYLDGTLGADGEAVDVYLGPVLDPDHVFVVHQRKKSDGFASYDEDKVMLGWSSEESARAAYLEQYDDPRFLGGITTLTVEYFTRRLPIAIGRAITAAVAWRADATRISDDDCASPCQSSTVE